MTGIRSSFLNMAAALLTMAGGSVAMAQGTEVLTYDIEWRLIPAGTAKLTMANLSRPSSFSAAGNGPAVSEVRLHLESAGLVSRLFRVSDDYTAMQGQNFCTQSSLMI